MDELAQDFSIGSFSWWKFEDLVTTFALCLSDLRLALIFG